MRTRKIGTLTLLMALSVANGASAASATNPEVDRYLQAAAALYDQLQFERALDQLQRVKTLEVSVDQDVRLHLYEGMLLAELGRPLDAEAAFTAALYLRPDDVLPAKTAPKIAAQFEAIRAKVKATLPGPPPPHVDTAPTSPPAEGRSPLRVVASAGLLGLGAGAAWYGGWSLQARSLSAQNQSASSVPSAYNSEIRTFTAQAVVGFSLAAALAGAGAWLWFSGAPETAESASGAMVVPTAQGWAVVWTHALP